MVDATQLHDNNGYVLPNVLRPVKGSTVKIGHLGSSEPYTNTNTILRIAKISDGYIALSDNGTASVNDTFMPNGTVELFKANVNDRVQVNLGTAVVDIMQ